VVRNVAAAMLRRPEVPKEGVDHAILGKTAREFSLSTRFNLLLL